MINFSFTTIAGMLLMIPVLFQPMANEFFWHVFHATFRSMFALGMVLVILCFSFQKHHHFWIKVLSFQVFGVIARISYFTYLIHIPVYELFVPLFIKDLAFDLNKTISVFVLATGLCFVLAYAFNLLVERPIRQSSIKKRKILSNFDYFHGRKREGIQ